MQLLLGDSEWSQWSDREIARRCQVGYTIVNRMRQGASAPYGQIARKVQRGGTVYEMNVSTKKAADDTAKTETSLTTPVTRTDPLGTRHGSINV